MICIVNTTENWGIGRGNELLVSIRADLRRFRSLTTGKTVILGRKTLAGFPGGRPLKNRVNLVLSRAPGLEIPGAEVLSSEQALFRRLRQTSTPALCVIGGESVYRLLLPYCHTVLLTRTFGAFDADRFFPDLDATPNWYLHEAGPVLEEDGLRFQYLEYRNRAPQPLPQ